MLWTNECDNFQRKRVEIGLCLSQLRLLIMRISEGAKISFVWPDLWMNTVASVMPNGWQARGAQVFFSADQFWNCCSGATLSRV